MLIVFHWVFKFLAVLGFASLCYAVCIVVLPELKPTTKPAWFPRNEIKMAFKIGVILIAVAVVGVLVVDILNSITVLPGKLGIIFKWTRL